jgi:hypothetical protein
MLTLRKSDWEVRPVDIDVARRLVAKYHYAKGASNTATYQVDAMLESQGGKCAICGATEGYNFPAVDHCHSTGKIRGILCDRCNRGLGFFKDNVAILRAAADYLERARKS